MKNLISFQLACRILVSILLLLTIFHLLILFGVFPGDIVWGSQISDNETLIFMEIISLAVTLLFLINTIVYIKDKSSSVKRKIARMLLWFMSGYFLLNIIGNLSSSSQTESLIFSPIALVLSLLSLRLAIEK